MSKLLDETISKGILAKFGYKLRGTLGEGAFGVVYKCEKDGQIYAMKIVANDDENVVKKEIDASSRSRKFRFNKLEECADFFHSSSRGVFIGKGESGSRTQSIPRGESALLKRRGGKTGLTIDTTTQQNMPAFYYAVFKMFLLDPLGSGFDHSKYRNLLKSIAQVLFTAHGRGILHSDIKPDNIMASGNNFKLNDWGEQIDLTNVKNYELIPKRGAVVFQAPEYEKIENWTRVVPKNIFKTDIYRLGASVLYIFLKDQGETSIDDIPSVVANLHSGNYHKKYAADGTQNSEDTKKLLNLLKGMTDPDVGKRYNAKQVLSHSYL